MWYNCLNEYLLRERYTNKSICPCIFMKRSRKYFYIIVVYVDDIKIIGTPGEIPKAINLLKKQFEIKDIEKTKLCVDLQIEYFDSEIFLH